MTTTTTPSPRSWGTGRLATTFKTGAITGLYALLTAVSESNLGHQGGCPNQPSAPADTEAQGIRRRHLPEIMLLPYLIRVSDFLGRPAAGAVTT